MDDVLVVLRAGRAARRVRGALAGLMVIGVMALASAPTARADGKGDDGEVGAAAVGTVISSAGPLTGIGVDADLNCSVDAFGEQIFYLQTACGTFLTASGLLFGPASLPAGVSASPRTSFAPVSQSAVTGTGTSADPFKITTIVSAGQLLVTQVDSYVVGESSFTTDMTLANIGEGVANGVLYRAADCFSGVTPSIGTLSGANVGCRSSRTAVEFQPVTAGSSYIAGDYDDVWAAVGSKAPLPNTCVCASELDGGVGLSWNYSVLDFSQVTFSARIFVADIDPLAACRPGAPIPNGYSPVYGTSGNDVLTAGAGSQIVFGSAGADRIEGGSGFDILCGGDGADVITDSSGNDQLSGGAGDDRLNGGSGDDVLYGGKGSDRLDGGPSGNDRGIDPDPGTVRISIERNS